ncbi:MAG: hypothetical protein J5720_02550 [Bacteroidaceae bacterium]|nr:hypothetical protein [Bacteroidaceae bacterium]
MAQLINGEVVGKVGEMTFYPANGKMIVRTANNKKNKTKTEGQFRQLMHFLNLNQLWGVMKQTERVYFEGTKSSAQRQFLHVNNYLPHIYLPEWKNGKSTAVLLQGMVVSDGSLPSFDYQLGEFQGEPALLTTLVESDAQIGELLLYVFQQVEEMGEMKIPSIRTKVIEINKQTDEVKIAFSNGCLVLSGSMFADDMSGFALVRVVDGHASRQTLVTHCTYYQQFTTDEALMTAAESYGKVKKFITVR